MNVWDTVWNRFQRRKRRRKNFPTVFLTSDLEFVVSSSDFVGFVVENSSSQQNPTRSGLESEARKPFVSRLPSFVGTTEQHKALAFGLVWTPYENVNAAIRT